MIFPRGCASKASSRNLLRLISNPAPLQRSSFAFSSIHAASSSTRASQARTAIPKSAPLKLPSRPNLTLEQQKAAYHADKLYQAGKTALFRAPSHFAYLLGSWLLGLGCISTAAYIYLDGHWKQEPDSPLPFFVPVANMLTLLIIASLGPWVLIRASNLVAAIDLIKTAAGIRMRISVRRALPAPFVPHREIIIAPYDLHLPRSAIRPATVPQFATMPQENDSSKPLRFGTWVARKISFTLWSFFAGQRKIFTHEGFLIASINGKNAFKIDIDGTFPDGAWSLVDVSTLEVD